MNFPHTCYLYLFTDTNSMAVYVPSSRPLYTFSGSAALMLRGKNSINSSIE